jgi:NADPH2:quinone reductase
LTATQQGSYIKDEPETVPEIWRAILELVRQGRLRPVIYDKLYDGLEALPEGLRALSARETWGKAVLRVKKEDGRAKL